MKRGPKLGTFGSIPAGKIVLRSDGTLCLRLEKEGKKGYCVLNITFHAGNIFWDEDNDETIKLDCYEALPDE